ncbi:MAG: ChbG/HpnK family deacetylase [Legionellales bacterium]|nr:ChbG/HpnK family deacetylase [Legionellales bacterium]
MQKSIILCADDFGLNEGINEGILGLVKQKRLSAVSCMMNIGKSQLAFSRLKPYEDSIDIGLHFNLTEGTALTGVSSLTDETGKLRSINQLLVRSTVRSIKQRHVEQELEAQLNQFEAAFGRLPDFIDGHQHIHHLPIVSDSLLHIYQLRLSAHRPFIRSVYVPWLQTFQSLNSKIFIIQLTGAHQFLSLLKKQSIPHNTSFAGFYNFDATLNYQVRFHAFLSTIQQGGLIMCHPGLFHQGDLITMARQNECAYFASEAFIDDCALFQATITRFGEMVK